MKWIRRAREAWKNRSKRMEFDPSRRALLKGAAGVVGAVALGASFESCAAFVTREYGFDKEYSTRYPGSVRDVIERVPKVGELEIGFIKERKAGVLVGASVNRENVSTTLAYNNWKRDPRSTIHTHPIEKGVNPRIHTYPSPNDFHWILDRVRGKNNYPMTMRTIHIAPVTAEGKAMGICSVRLGNRWLRVEKDHPEMVEEAWGEYFRISWYRITKKITFEEYSKRLHAFFERMKPLGIQVRLTPYPGFKVENGFIVPKG